MFFRNLTLFRFSPAVADDVAERLHYSVADRTLRDVGPLEVRTCGFVPPLGDTDDLVHESHDGRYLLVCMGTQQRMLPPAVITEELARRLKAIADTEGRRVGGHERKRLREDIITDLLPRAFVRRTRTAAYLDLADGWLVVDTATRSTAETVVTLLREALGSFPALHLAPEQTPSAVMTAWLRTPGQLTDAWPCELTDECELRDLTSAQGAIIRARREDLDRDEMREHLAGGKRVTRLGLVYDDMVGFVLGEDLVARKLRFTDVATDALADAAYETIADEDAAHFVLQTGLVARLLAGIERVFDVRRPEDDA